MLILAPLYLAWTWTHSIGQLGGDGGAYLMMAQHYSPYPQHDLVYAEAATSSRFPPLYPMLLAFSGGAESLPAAHLVTTACLLLAFLALYAWALQTGLEVRGATLLVLLLASLPGTWKAGLMVQSEFLYLGLSLAALGLIDAGRAAPEPRTDIFRVAALAVGAAILTRTIGVTLLPALLLGARRSPLRSQLINLLLAMLPLLLWKLAHRSPSDYTEVLRALYGHGEVWKALRQQLATELPALVDGYVGNFMLGHALAPLALLLGLLSLAACLWRLLRLEPDAAYAVANLAVLAIWPFPEEAQRFVWVLLPVFFIQVTLLARQVLSRNSSFVSVAALSAVVLAMTMPAVAEGAARYRAESDVPDGNTFVQWYGPDAADSRRDVSTQVMIINALRAIHDAVPANDCVVSIRPDLVNYYGARRSGFVPLNSVPDPDFLALLKSGGCHYIFALGSANTRYPVPLHPLQRLRQGQAEVVYASTYKDADDKEYALAVLVRLPD